LIDCAQACAVLCNGCAGGTQWENFNSTGLSCARAPPQAAARQSASAPRIRAVTLISSGCSLAAKLLFCRQREV
jgi:hypothetical protein